MPYQLGQGAGCRSNGLSPAAVGGGPAELFERHTFDSFVLALPAVTLSNQWEDTSVAKVGDKMFALHRPRGALAFKCTEMAFELLPQLDGIEPAPYLARARWVSVERGAALTTAELGGYLREAHRLVAAKLTRRVRTALGLG